MQEFQNVFKNLDTYKKTLDAGVPLEQAKRTLPFVHNEQKDIKIGHQFIQTL